MFRAIEVNRVNRVSLSENREYNYVHQRRMGVFAIHLLPKVDETGF
jgi:hypothetical protein